MQTTKQTVITLDAGDAVIIRTMRPDGTRIECEVSAHAREDTDPALTVQSSEIVWMRVNGGDDTEHDGKNQLIAEYADVTITLV